MTTISGNEVLGPIGETETVPGLKRQIPSDLQYLMTLRHNWVKSLAPQIVVPNQAWMGQVPDVQSIPVSSTDYWNAYSRSIHQSHAFRSKQIFFGN